jgi:hypothetical protein
MSSGNHGPDNKMKPLAALFVSRRTQMNSKSGLNPFSSAGRKMVSFGSTSKS